MTEQAHQPMISLPISVFEHSGAQRVEHGSCASSAGGSATSSLAGSPGVGSPALTQLFKELKASPASWFPAHHSARGWGVPLPPGSALLTTHAAAGASPEGSPRCGGTPSSSAAAGTAAASFISHPAFFAEEHQSWLAPPGGAKVGSSSSCATSPRPPPAACCPSGPGLLMRAGGGLSTGRISRAKAVLAEAMRGAPGGTGLMDAPSLRGTGVLLPLLAMIRSDGHCHANHPNHWGAPHRRSDGDSAVQRRLPLHSASFSVRSNSSAALAETLAGRRSSCCDAPYSRSLSEAACNCHTTGTASTPASREGSECDEPCCGSSACGGRRSMMVAAALPPEQQLCDALETVCLLAVDEANREALIELGAPGVVAAKLRPGGASVEVQAAALYTLRALVRYEEDKRRLWQHSTSGSAALLALLASYGQPAAGSHQQQQALMLPAAQAFAEVRRLGFSGGGGDRPVLLLEPRLVGVAAGLLQPGCEPAVLCAALELLTDAAQSPGAAQLEGWQAAAFQLAPLLLPLGHGGSGGCEEGVVMAALELLMVLSELAELRPVLCAAGCLPPLLALFFDGGSTLAVRSVCILTSLVHCRLGAEALAAEPSLCVLLRLLQERSGCADTCLGALYVLRVLAGQQASVVAVLRQHGAAPLLQRWLAETHDEDVRHGCSSLLRLMGQGAPHRRHHYQQQPQEQEQQHAQQLEALLPPALPPLQAQQVLQPAAEAAGAGLQSQPAAPCPSPQPVAAPAPAAARTVIPAACTRMASLASLLVAPAAIVS